MDNVSKFSFMVEFHLPFKKVIANLQVQKEKFKGSFLKWRNHQLLLGMHEVRMKLICIHVAV